MTELRITGRLTIGEIKKSFKTNWDVLFYIDKKYRTNTKTRLNDKLNLRQLFEKGEWLTRLVLPEFMQSKMGNNFILINDNTTVGQVRKSFKDAGFEAWLHDKNDKHIDSNIKLKDVYAN
jgi:hypothetical protein